MKGAEPYMGDDNAFRLLHGAVAYTLIVDGCPVASAGVTPLWKGVGEVWAVMTVEAKVHKLYIVRGMRRILFEVIRIRNLHRVQAYVRAKEPTHCKLMEAVGLQPEAFLAQYFPDKADARLFAKVIE